MAGVPTTALARVVPRSLTSRLVVTAVVLVAVVAVLIAGATTIALRASLMDRLDRDVVDLARRPPSLLLPGRSDAGGPDFARSAPGTLEAVVGETGGIAGSVQGEDTTLSDEAMELLAAVPADGDIHSVDIPGHGTYRVVANGGRLVRSDSGEPVTYVSGLPTTDVDDTITSLVLAEVVLSLLGILVAAAAGVIVVRRQLRPLREVAATAHAVSEIPLASGDIGPLERVPDHLTDEQTEAGQVGAALNQLLEHVETSLASRYRSEQQVRQFVADASHELRTPLTTIAGYTELARRRPDAETAALALAKVEEEAGRMTSLVEDLLLLARLDAGRPLAAVRTDLTQVLLEAVNDARVVAPDHRWRFEQADGEPVTVTGDPQRLHQVITNLLANARKHTPAGTTVTVSVQQDGFTVRDDGPGFSPDLARTAFERFTRGDASRHRSDGVGLGLALVQAIVAAHGGSVSLASVPGDTAVRVVLPSGSQQPHRPA